MHFRSILRLAITLLSGILILTFAWLSSRPMPTPPLPSPSAPPISPSESQNFRVLAIVAEGADRELLSLAAPSLVAELKASEDLTFTLSTLATGLQQKGEEEPEPFWRTAMRRGLRAAVLFWPEIYPDSDLRADYTVAPASCYGGPSLHTVTFSQTLSIQTLPSPSFSPPLEGSVEIRGEEGGLMASLRLWALDSSDDGKTNYDAVLLEGSQKPLRPGEWLALEVDHHLHSGAFFKLLELSPDAKKAILYRTPLCYNYALPPALLQGLNRELGFFPPPADPQSLAKGWITLEDVSFLEKERVRWATKATALVWEQYKPDLLLAHFPQTSTLTAESLKMLAEGVKEGEIMMLISLAPEGFLAVYGGEKQSLAKLFSLSTEDIAPLLLSLLLK